MLDALGYDRVDVLGVSLGGVVAQQLAHHAPRRVRRLVLAATGPGLGGAPGSPRVLLALATPRRYYQPDYYRRIAGRIYGGQARRDPDALLHGSPARFVERPSVRGYLGQMYAAAARGELIALGRLARRLAARQGRLHRAGGTPPSATSAPPSTRGGTEPDTLQPSPDLVFPNRGNSTLGGRRRGCSRGGSVVASLAGCTGADPSEVGAADHR